MKTGRNESCPCGSGLKYKQCCLRGPNNGSVELVQYIGYDKSSEGKNPFFLSDVAIVCMVSNIVELNIEPIREMSGIDFQLGDWFCSTGVHKKTVVHGPFGKIDDAFEFGRVTAGAVRFLAPPEFEGF